MWDKELEIGLEFNLLYKRISWSRNVIFFKKKKKKTIVSTQEFSMAVEYWFKTLKDLSPTYEEQRRKEVKEKAMNMY